MRKLMWFTIGFTAACAAGVYLLSGAWLLLIGLFCLIGCVAVLCLKSKWGKVAGVALLGCVVGFSWLWGYDSLYLSTARSYDGQTVYAVITASDYSYTPNYGQAFDGRIECDGKTYQVRCYLNSSQPIQPADVISGEFLLRYTADGGEKEATYHQGSGIFLLAYQKSEITVQTGQKLRILDYMAMWRKRIITVIGSAFPADSAGFAKALLLGDTTDLTYSQDRAFQVSGIRHVIAVSGLHVSILFSLIYLVFGRQRVLNAVFGIPLLALFAAVAGFSPSIIRACTMQVLMVLAMLVDKEYDPPTALAFAVLVILGINPRAITSVSFQLSVGCMIGIFAFSESLRQYFLSFGKLKAKSKGKSMQAKLIRWATGSVSVTLSAMVVTTPLCAVYFGMVSVVGVISNLLTLWVISFIFYGIMLACLAALLWLPLAKGIGWIVAWPIRYILNLSDLLAHFPLAAVYTDSVYIVFWLVFSYILLAAFFLLKKKHPGMAAVGISAGLCICVALSWLEPKLDDVRVSVIDVGQGQSILLQQGEKHYLVDCGGSSASITADKTANFLLSQGVFRLDGVVLTHYDADHAGSILNLLTAIRTDKIYMPNIYDSNGLREQIEKVYSGKICLISQETRVPLQDGRITLFPAKTTDNDNESSVCVLFQAGNCDILITGDRSAAGEKKLLAQTQLPILELLVVGHHGSNQATSNELLMATRPKLAVISVARDNPYGHPRQEVLDRLARYGCQIRRTDLEGTVIFRR